MRFRDVGIQRRDGGILLFDGATTQGWLQITGKPFPSNCWTIEDHCLKALVRLDGFQDIRTVQTFRSFDLRFDWKLPERGNSGVEYRIQKVDEWVNTEGRQARARGLEYQLADDKDPDAASDQRRVAGSLYSVIAPSPRVPPRINAFNESRIVVAGKHVEHWLNGQRESYRSKCSKRTRRKLRNSSAPTWLRTTTAPCAKKGRSACRTIHRKRGSGISGLSACSPL